MSSYRMINQPCGLVLVIVVCGLVYLLLPLVIQFFEIKPTEYNITNSPRLIVHYIRLYKSETPISKLDLSFLDCLSLISVMVNLKPDAVYIHTNVPAYSYHHSCRNMSIEWNLVKVIGSPLKTMINGTVITRIEHEADIKKLESVYHYGGVVLDFDVYIVDVRKIREILRNSECIISHEQHIINAGLLACSRPDARFPREMLETYESDFRPSLWVYNSGEKPMEVYKRNKTGIHLDDTIDNSPHYFLRHEMIEQYGIHNWTTKQAYHSFLHNSTFGPLDLAGMNSSFGELLRWIADKGGYTITSRLFSSTVYVIAERVTTSIPNLQGL